MLSMESRSKGKQLMSRYRKTMAQAMNESAINMQIAILKKNMHHLKQNNLFR